MQHFISNEAGLKASQDFYSTLKTRRSIRNFSSEPVDQEIIVNALKVAHTAPSGANSQPWYFAVIKSQELKDAVRVAAEKVEWEFYHRGASQTWLDDLAKLGTNHHKPYLSEAPYLIAVFSRIKSADAQERTYYPMESTGIAVGFLLAALHQAGLNTLTHTPRPMGFLNQLLGLDSTYRAYMLLVVGKAHEAATVPSLVKKSWDEVSCVY